MRAAYVCTDPGIPLYGSKGASIHVRSVVRALRDRGVAISVFARNQQGDSRAELDGAAIIPLPRLDHVQGAAREELAARQNADLGQALERHGPFDLIYERYSLFSSDAMEFARKRSIPGLLEVNSPLILEQREYRTLVSTALASAMTRRAMAAAHRVLFVSAQLLPHFDELVEPDRVRVVPNAVDPKRFPTPARGSTDGIFRVGFVSSLRPWHGLNLLVDIFEQLRLSLAEARLIVVGDGPGRSELEAAFEQRGLADAVEFSGAVPSSQVPVFLDRMDAALAPYPRRSDFYFSPLKIVEYMAAGLPVVASAQGQVCELIDNRDDGFLIDSERPQDFATVLVELARDPKLSARVGQQAREKILTKYTWDRVAGTVLDYAREAMA